MSSVCSKRLGDLITFKRGYDLPEQNRIIGPYPVISSAGISGLHNDYKVEGKGVVTGRYGTLGEMYFVDGKYWPHNTALYVQDFKGNDPKYIYYLLSCLGRIRTSDKSAVPGVNRNELHEMFVPAIEEKSTQIAIRQVLEILDAKIELNNRINAELEAMAKTLYDYWFVQFDFPDANGKPYKTSGGKMVYNAELKRDVPEGWDFKKIGNYAEVLKGDLITAKEANDGDFKVVAAGVSFSYMHSDFNRLKNTITISGSGANAGFINFWREPIFASDCITVRCKTDVETLLLLNYLRFIQNHILSQATGSAQPHVYPNDIKRLGYLIPTDFLIDDYEKIAIPLNNQIAKNLAENEQLVKLRDWLLPMLMNGQVTIKNSSI
ncbi:MAG: hypothetical protein RLZ92_898 [Pseudomonadota bacterium]|jgi:type I restriction enzyme S subunit